MIYLLAMVNSRSKGQRGEREHAQWLRENLGVEAYRGRQYHGRPEAPDVVGIPGTHPEVKRVERLNVQKALEQATEDSGEDQVPYVAFRRNDEPWKIACWADDWVDLCQTVLEACGYEVTYRR